MNMATKNLARTAIEGGRTGHNKWDRKLSHKETRAKERSFLTEVKGDIENYYEYDIDPTRPVRKEFADKLAPMYRWLEHQVGKSWDEVRSEVTKAFDTRTTAGRHIVYDHLLRSVEITPSVWRFRYRSTGDPNTSYSKHDFYVNDIGILCQRRHISRDYLKAPQFNTNQIANWLNGRVVGKIGKKFFWFVPADKNKKGGWHHEWKTEWKNNDTNYWQKGGLRYLYLTYQSVYAKDKDGVDIVVDRKPYWAYGEPIFRQDRKINEKEMLFWNSLPEFHKTKVLERSPIYPNPPQEKIDYY